MSPQIPYFKYRSRDAANKLSGCIEVDGEIIHKIDNVEEFHKSFGYTKEMAKAGKLPDEFIWETYVKNTAVNCAPCFQLHMIEYLLKYSAAFLEKYREQYDDWITTPTETRATNGDLCLACKIKRQV